MVVCTSGSSAICDELEVVFAKDSILPVCGGGGTEGREDQLVFLDGAVGTSTGEHLLVPASQMPRMPI
jgi:hypothetical protein